MGQTYVYNAGEAEESNEETPIPIGIFFDGTANNRVNTLIRKKIKK